jgi:hypothetical protein
MPTRFASLLTPYLELIQWFSGIRRSMGLSWLLSLVTLIGLALPLSAEAAIAFRSSSQSGVSNGDLLISVPPGTANGDTLIASVAIRPNSITVATPPGWTLVRRTQQTNDISMSLYTFFKFAAAEPSGYTFTVSGGHSGIVGGIVAFSGANTNYPPASQDAATTGSGYTVTAPSITTAVPNSMLITSHAFTSSPSAWYTPGGMTEAVDATSMAKPDVAGMGLEMNYELIPSAVATGTRVATAESAGTDAAWGAGQSMYLRPAVGSLATATTVAASSITTTSAVLNGLITANGGVSTVVFDYGTSPAYGTSVTATQSPLANTSVNAAVNTTITGLTCGTTYNFRVRANNGVGSANGADMTFTTSPCMYCYSDDFNRGSGLGADWAASATIGTFTPTIVNNRLRINNTNTNSSTFTNLKRLFPSANNRVEITFNNMAYGGSGDGIAAVLSDGSVTPVAGAFGGALGYAQRDTGFFNPKYNGFAGGWLGVGIDEFGNFSDPNEGRIGGPGQRADSVTVRGSGSGMNNYRYHANSGTINPYGVDNSEPRIDYVGQGGTYSVNNGNVTPALPGHQAEDLLLCAATSNDAVPHFVGTSGWQQVYQLSGTPQSSLWWKRATSNAETNPTITHNAPTGMAGIVAQCAAFRYVDGTTPFDVAYVSGHGVDASATNLINTGSMSTVSASDMMLFMGHLNDDRCSPSVSTSGGLTWNQTYCGSSDPPGTNNEQTVTMYHAVKATPGAVGPVAFSVGGGGHLTRGVLVALRPAAHRYKITFDHSNGTNAYVKVERDAFGGSNMTTLIAQYDAKAQTNQAAVPTNFQFSLTGSTGGSVNVHEIDNLQICSTQPILSTNGPNHIRIEHTGNGVTCTPSTLTIKACGDASCSTTYLGGVTGTLTPSTGSPTVNWTGGASFTIPSGSATVTKEVQVTTPGIVSWGTSGTTTPVSAAATQCYIGATADCNYTAADAGFIFDVPNHRSETSQSITVSAVKKSDNALSCIPAFTTSKSVNFKCAYSNPATGTLPVRLTSGSTYALNTGNSASAACDNTGQNVSLSFNASGIATMSLLYADAGSMTLRASYTGTTGLETGLVMTGSDPFIAAPNSFSVVNTPTSPATFYVAGDAFTTTIQARNAAGNVTPNFGKETTAPTAALTHTVTGGTDGTAGTDFAGLPSAFTINGTATATSTNTKWREVGAINVIATTSNYLTSGLNVTGTGAAGAFRPAYFETVVTGADTSGNYSYSGQPFTTQVTAKSNWTGNPTTTNYEGAYAKTVTLSDANSATNNSGTLGAFTNATVPAASFNNGVASTNTITYTLSRKDRGPLEDVGATLHALALRAVDTDTVTSSGHLEGRTGIRSGRLRVDNAYGSPVSPLTLPGYVEYWDGTRWITNPQDEISNTGGSPWSITPAGSTALGCFGASGSTTITMPNAAAAGLTVGSATAPGAGRRGCLDYTVDVPDWLEFAWNGCANINACTTAELRDPTARIEFGQYNLPGNSRRIIYRREMR